MRRIIALCWSRLRAGDAGCAGPEQSWAVAVPVPCRSALNMEPCEMHGWRLRLHGSGRAQRYFGKLACAEKASPGVGLETNDVVPVRFERDRCGDAFSSRQVSAVLKWWEHAPT